MAEIRKRKKKSNRLKKLIVIIGVIALLGTGTVGGIFAYAARDLPVWNPEQLSGANTTFLYDDNDQVMSQLHAEENRTEISLDKVPDNLVKAFIATEDQDFYDHHGVNFKGIARALVRNFQSRDLTGQGASTITQQLARNAFLSFDKQWERKVKEVILAFKLESAFSKDEIMAMYLNKIYFGAGAYGVQAAASTYFGKDVSELTLPECALLAGLPQSPNGYNPFQYYDRAKARQKIVLNNMVNCGYIDQTSVDEAFNTELIFKKSNISNNKYGYFVDAVIDEALTIISKQKIYDDPENAIYRAGLKIYTTMDASMQSHAEELYSNANNFPNQNANGEPVQSAMVLMEHSSGEVKALMGGRGYEQRRGFNRATSAYRQPGSSIKPISVYAPALENGYMPFYVLDDSPISYKSSGSVWSPKNYDGSYKGLITMRTAVQWSINTYAVQMLDKVGVRTGFDYAKSMGLELIDTPGTNDLGLAPLSLGGLTRGATPMQMAGAYGTLGNGGVYVKPHLIRKIVDNNGIEIYKAAPGYNRAMSEQSAWLMGNMLQTVVNAGTGTNAKVPGVVTMGKTGTSEEYKDSWFCGYTPGYSVAVWMGFDKEHTMNKVYGGGYPAKIFRSMLVVAHQKNNPHQRPMPTGITQVSVCSKSGKLPSESCPEDLIITEYCLSDSLPKDTCDGHEYVYICPESGKLAGKYCPNPEMRVLVKTGDNSHTTDKIPTETCDIHTDVTIPGMFTNEVYVCRDPRNEGQLYRANVPNPMQSGGCPQEYLEKIMLRPGQKLPKCPLDDHQLATRKAKDIIDDVRDH
ncbi:MAG: penicillin-binding protein 1A [Syntrophomonadaceae bacterium]|nr:penicillin-binding protein 1A [Syntrophomonadaceae bacterium]